MSRKNISYVKGYEHSDFTDLLNELQGKIEKIQVELKNDNNEKIIKEAQEKIKDLNEQIRNII